MVPIEILSDAADALEPSLAASAPVTASASTAPTRVLRNCVAMFMVFPRSGGALFIEQHAQTINVFHGGSLPNPSLKRQKPLILGRISGFMNLVAGTGFVSNERKSYSAVCYPIET